MAQALTHEVVIIGGGSAGIATASSMLRRRPGLDIAIVEPAEDHLRDLTTSSSGNRNR